MSPLSLTPRKAWRVPKVQQALYSCPFSIFSAGSGQTCPATLPSAGSLTEAAEKALGHKVVIKRFMVTVWGRTGFLQPEMEFAPLVGECSCSTLSSSHSFRLFLVMLNALLWCAECTSVMTSRSVVLDLGIPVVQTSDLLQYKSQSPMRRSCSSNSIVSACDHFEFYKESYG